MTADPLRQQIAREVKRALYDADMRAPEAARRMQVLTGKPAEPKTIYRWAKGEVLAPLDRLADLATAIDQPITLRLGTQTESAPPPEWAEGLVDRIADDLRQHLLGVNDDGRRASRAGRVNVDSHRSVYLLKQMAPDRGRRSAGAKV